LLAPTIRQSECCERGRYQDDGQEVLHPFAEPECDTRRFLTGVSAVGGGEASVNAVELFRLEFQNGRLRSTRTTFRSFLKPRTKIRRFEIEQDVQCLVHEAEATPARSPNQASAALSLFSLRHLHGSSAERLKPLANRKANKHFGRKGTNKEILESIV
jgi:hypothetical protein